MGFVFTEALGRDSADKWNEVVFITEAATDLEIGGARAPTGCRRA